MRKSLVVALSIVSLSAFAVTAQAKPAHNTQNWQQKRMSIMQKKLDLTDSQRQQIEQIYDNAATQHKAIRDDVRQQVNNVLTDEQRQKATEQRSAQKQQWQKKGKSMTHKKAHKKVRNIK